MRQTVSMTSWNHTQATVFNGRLVDRQPHGKDRRLVRFGPDYTSILVPTRPSHQKVLSELALDSASEA